MPAITHALAGWKTIMGGHYPIAACDPEQKKGLTPNVAGARKFVNCRACKKTPEYAALPEVK